MDARRNNGHIVPKMTSSIYPTSKNDDSSDDDFEEGQSRLQALDLNRQSRRMVGTNQKGKFEVPRTNCWKRFIEQPHKHVLNCGHVTTTETRQACGINCRLSKKAKNTPHGSLIKCDTCIEKRKQAASPLVPRKKARRFSNPERSMKRMGVDEDEGLFVNSSAINDGEDLDYDVLQRQLDDAGYNRPRRNSIIEPPLTPTANPRKRRAVDVPGFNLTDYPTGEKPKRRGSRGAVHVPDDNELQAIRKQVVLDDEPKCICGHDKDEDLLECVWCHRDFHPTCAGHARLTRYEHSTYVIGQKEFCCEECNRGLEDAVTREAAEKKAMQAARGRKHTTAAEVMAEASSEMQNQRSAKERRKMASQNHVLRKQSKKASKREAKAKAKAKGRGRKRDSDSEDEDRDDMEVDEPKTPKSALKRCTSNPPPPASVRFALSENRVSRRKSMERMEIDD